MSFTDRKITDGERDAMNVKSTQGSRLTGTVQENKNVFDRLVEFFVERYNLLIDDLTEGSGETSAAEGIGSAAIEELKDPADPTKQAITVWKQIKAIVLLLTGHTGRTDNPHRVTKGQLGLGNVENTADANKPISTAAQAAIDMKLTASLASDFVKNVTLDRTTGTLTFYQHDGTSFSIDTVLEKVPISCRLDGTDFVLALDDGTEQRVNLSAFVDVYTFSSTETVKFVKTGNAYTAEVPDGSISRGKLADAVLSELIGLEQSARQAAESANTDELAASASAELASQKATSASASATLAESKATVAYESAERATVEASEAGLASAVANSAKIAAETAKEDAVSAKTAAETARDSAVAAKNDALTASTESDAARDGAITAKDGAVTAKTAAETAKTTAEAAATSANVSELTAETAKNAAEASKLSAAWSATTAEQKAVLATAEADRAKAEADRASEIVGGDFATKSEVSDAKNEAVSESKTYTDAKKAEAVSEAKNASVPIIQKGVAGGVASLDGGGKVPSGQLPAMNYDPIGTANTKVSAHNGAADSHSALFAGKADTDLSNILDADFSAKAVQAGVGGVGGAQAWDDTKITDLMTAIANISGGGSAWTVEDVAEIMMHLSRYNAMNGSPRFVQGTVTTAGASIALNDCSIIKMLTNDGEKNIQLVSSTNTILLELKAGESITDLSTVIADSPSNIKIRASVTTDTYSYRCLYR